MASLCGVLVGRSGTRRRGVVREFRGVVRWAIRPHRENPTRRMYSHRAAIGSTYGLPTRKDRPPGSCAWCWTPKDPGQHTNANYHPDCVIIMTALKGIRETPYGKPLVPRGLCECGEEATELDHIVPLSIAVMDGLRVWIRAFMPSNLQWLCRECHRRKTSKDRADLARRRNGIVTAQPGYDPDPELEQEPEGIQAVMF